MASPAASADAAAPAPDGYEITTWYRKDWLDAAAVWLESFGVKHRVTLGYVFLIAMTIGLILPYVPVILTPVGILLTLAAVVPIMVVMLLFWRSDRTAREPLGLVFRTFLLGATFAVLAALVNTQLGWLPDTVKYLFVVGPGEEIVKLFAVFAFVYHHKEFDHAIDGLFYGVAAGAGFAAIENVMYVINAGVDGGLGAAWATAIVRALISTPGHAIWTGFAGYYLGVAKFGPPEHRRTLVIKGLMIVAVVHGLFDIVVSAGLGIVGLVLGAAMHVGMLWWLVRKARAYYAFHGLHAPRRVTLAVPVVPVAVPAAVGAPVTAAAAPVAPAPAPASSACGACGAAVAPGARFCPSCGARASCASCAAPLAGGARFCPSCGQPAAAGGA